MESSNNHQDSTPVWDDEAFRARVEKLAAGKGKSVRQICSDAGLAADYLNKSAEKKGRSILSIMLIADKLGVSVTDLIEPALVGIGAAEDVDPDTLGRLSLTAHVAAHLYLSLDSRRNIPSPTDAERIVRLIIDMLDLPRRPKASPQD